MNADSSLVDKKIEELGIQLQKPVVYLLYLENLRLMRSLHLYSLPLYFGSFACKKYLLKAFAVLIIPQ